MKLARSLLCQNYKLEPSFVDAAINRKLLPPASTQVQSSDRHALELAAHVAALAYALQPEQHRAALLYPVLLLVRAPNREAFLPGMPSDPFSEIRKMANSPDRNQLCLYVCKNEHPILMPVGRRLSPTDRCSHCGVQLGKRAESSVAVGNILLAQEDPDQTRPAHVLGFPASRSQLLCERTCTAAEFGLLRCLTHASLLAAALIQPEACPSLFLPTSTCTCTQ